ncbi:hypothetical protein DFH27DRAFT_555423 [Peziza echinospora]|nr:hypothetical protein DFH27DRAFT_555423 [Peziza echinospora]
MGKPRRQKDSDSDSDRGQRRSSKPSRRDDHSDSDSDHGRRSSARRTRDDGGSRPGPHATDRSTGSGYGSGPSYGGGGGYQPAGYGVDQAAPPAGRPPGDYGPYHPQAAYTPPPVHGGQYAPPPTAYVAGGASSSYYGQGQPSPHIASDWPQQPYSSPPPPPGGYAPPPAPYGLPYGNPYSPANHSSPAPHTGPPPPPRQGASYTPHDENNGGYGPPLQQSSYQYGSHQAHGYASPPAGAYTAQYGATGVPSGVPPPQQYGGYQDSYRAPEGNQSIAHNLHKYAPKHHSTAQESTLASLKPEKQLTEPAQSAHGQPVVPPSASTASGGGSGLLGFLKKRSSNKPTDILSTFSGALQTSLHDYARNLFPAQSTHQSPFTTSAAAADPNNPDLLTSNRHLSFAPLRTSIRHHPKWYVDGKDYMFAVSTALENAKHTIWIMDWWLSPELHLRRPAEKWTFPGDPPGGRYRLDNMLAAAAARGVEVKVIVYKEVEAALTLNSHYTKKALEARHANIAVMRHPDHVPDATNTVSDIAKEMKDGYKFGDFMKGLYGIKDGKVLFWAHHEKLVLVDAGWGEGQEKGFMGGLDLCFGRWDTNEHPIADLREDISGQVFLGQDYNNGRIMDFHTVDNWTQNKLQRTKSSRMGWSDVALSIQGPILKDLAMHFIQRWNFVYDEKYRIRFTGGERYKKLPELSNPDDPKVRKKLHGLKEKAKVKYGGYSQEGYGGPHHAIPGLGQYPYHGAQEEDPAGDSEDEGLGDRDGVRCQILRSASLWSHGTRETEHSICNAYIETIKSAQHFIYIENQFFITATSKEQSPILNLIGAAIVERILRAFKGGQVFKIILAIPAVPGFAGDLKDNGSLGTRAIMEFQYRSMNRDRGFSIIEQLIKGGIPADQVSNYLRFFNLRNYDRINYTEAIAKAEKESGVAYDAARQGTESKATGVGYGPYGGGAKPLEAAADQYANLEKKIAPTNEADRWASVARCLMLNGGDIREVPWYGAPEKEIDAFVSEELYIHSKLLIADDRTVICGSANLNDRSQLGDHDSEIAILIEDPTPLPSTMNGHPYIASHFAGTLRRQIFRKHLGLIPSQDLSEINDENMQPSPVPNVYDFDSEEDRLVSDPLGVEFTKYWEETARINTEAYRQVFRPVPDNGILNWKMYDEWFSAVFKAPEVKKPATKPGPNDPPVPAPKPETEWGHVVRRNFNPDPIVAVREVKEVLSRVRGHLVECPLRFLEEEDIAKEGVGLNALTETIYT